MKDLIQANKEELKLQNLVPKTIAYKYSKKMTGMREDKYENHRYHATKKKAEDLKGNNSSKDISSGNKHALLERNKNEKNI